MKKRILALVIAITFIADAMATPALAAAAELSYEDERIIDEYEGSEGDHSDAGEYAEDHADPVTDTEDEDSLYEDNGYADVETVNLPDAEDVSADEASGYREEFVPGFVLPENYKDPEPVHTEGDELLDLEREYITPGVNGSLPLRDQGRFGACWAFSSMGLAEFSLNSKNITGKDLSELHLAYYTFTSEVDPLGGTEGDQTYLPDRTGRLDVGGNYYVAGNTLAAWMGAADEKKAPYSGADSVNRGGSLTADAYDDEAHLTDIYRVSIHKNPELVKQLIKEHGAAGISFSATSGLTATTSGDIYNDKTNSYYNPVYDYPNHAVMIVGWDDDYSAENFVIDPGQDGAWLVRNSWLPRSYTYDKDISHQYSGYFWMSYAEATLVDEATFFVFDKADNYDNNYQYDGCPQDAVRNVTGAANIFTTSSEKGVGESLKAVSIDLVSADAEYVLDIYKTTDPDNPESGTKVYSKSGKTTYPGMNTIKLDTPVALNKGEDFSVVFRFKETTGVVTEEGYYDGWCDFSAKADAGQSFYYINRWTDCDVYESNIRIKAFTDDVDGTEVAPEAIEFKNGIGENGLTINKEDSIKIGYTVSPEGATNKSVIWASSDESVATVSKKGVVTAVDQGTATITATAKLGGVSQSFTVNVTRELRGIKIVGPEDRKLILGQSYPISVKGVPEGAKVTGEIIWSSGNNSTAYVENGRLYACGVNGTYITAKVKGTDFSAKFLADCTLAEPVVTAGRKNSKVTIGFDSVEGATSYIITRSVPNGTDMYGYMVYDDTDIATINSEAGKNSYTYEDDISAYHGKDHIVYRVSACLKKVKETGKAVIYIDVKTYTITYNAGAGKNPADNPVLYGQGERVYMSPPIPPKGYTAIGWYENTIRACIDQLPLYDGKWKPIYKNYSLTAKYEPNKYTIRYFPNGGTGTMETTLAQYDKAVSLRANSFSKMGYEFDGWNTDPDGTGDTFADKASVKNLTDVNNAEIRLYAQWGGAKFDVTLDANGGKIISGKTQADQVKIRVSHEGKYSGLPEPVLEGHEFKGWYTQKTGGVKVSNGDTVIDDATTLYARYEIIVCKVTFNGNGKTVNEQPKQIEYGTAYGPLPVLAKSGTSEFIGWFRESACINRVSDTTICKELTEHTLYAGWRDRTKLEAPSIYVRGTANSDGTYPEGQTFIELETETPGAVIYYTTVNDEQERKYTAPVRAFIAGKDSDYQFNVTARTVMEGDAADYYEDSSPYQLQTPLLMHPEAGDLAAEDEEAYAAKENPSGFWIAGVSAEGYTYQASAIKPDVRVYYGRKLLQEKTDYKLSYQNNINAYTLKKQDDSFNSKKAPAVTVTLSGNYSGKITEYFTIAPLNINDDSVSAPDIALAHNGKVQKGVTKVVMTSPDGKTVALKPGKDFDYGYPGTDKNGPGYSDSAFSGVNEDGYEVKISGKGNFTGERTFLEIITKNTLITKVTVKGVENKEWTGSERTLEKLQLKDKSALLTEGVHYNVEYRNNKDIGTATVIITGIASAGYSGTLIKTFKISGVPMSKVNIPSDMNGLFNSKYSGDYDAKSRKFVYTGDPFEVAGPETGNADYGLRIYYDHEDYALAKGTDYVVSYENNVNAGTATVTFTGLGRFEGSVKKTFGIAPYQIEPYDAERISVSCSDSTYEKGGACPAPKVTYKSPTDGKVKTLQAGADYTLKYSDNDKLTAGGTSIGKRPSVTVALKGNYKGSITVNFDISQKNIEETTLVAADKLYSAKKGNWQTSFKVLDTNGKPLNPGKDYDKDSVSITYASDTLLENGSLRKRGTVPQKDDIVKPGTVFNVTVTGSGCYLGTVSGSYRVFEYDISKADVKVNAQSYKGSEVRPGTDELTVTMKINNTVVTLRAGDYYIEGYSNNTGKGTGKVTVCGTGKYGGSKTATFAINAGQ